MKEAIPELQQPRWRAVFLVCRDCGKRSSGPKNLKPKALAGLIRHEAKQLETRTRVMMTNCMGLCPKSAVAVAGVGSGTRIVAIRSSKQVEDVDARMAAPDAVIGPVAGSQQAS